LHIQLLKAQSSVTQSSVHEINSTFYRSLICLLSSPQYLASSSPPFAPNPQYSASIRYLTKQKFSPALLPVSPLPCSDPLRPVKEGVLRLLQRLTGKPVTHRRQDAVPPHHISHSVVETLQIHVINGHPGINGEMVLLKFANPKGDLLWPLEISDDACLPY